MGKQGNVLHKMIGFKKLKKDESKGTKKRKVERQGCINREQNRCPYWVGPMILLFVSIVAYSQETVKYLNRNWQTVQLKSEAVYYRSVFKQDEGFLVRDFYIENDRLQMESICSALEPNLVLDGAASFYYKNGQLEKSGRYENNKPVGLHVSYYPDGKRKSEMFYDKDIIRIFQHWREDGSGQLINGTGIAEVANQETGESSFVIVKDSVMMASYILNGNGDRVYLQVSEMAQYEAGMEAMHRSMVSKMVYPRFARRNGIEGKVFIQFVVGERGQLEEPKVIRGIGGGCDEEALRVFQLQSKWIPARYEGKPVKMRMILPVIFRLR